MDGAYPTYMVALEWKQLDHKSVAAMRDSERHSILERVTEDLPWSDAQLVSHTTSQESSHTFVVVNLRLHRGGNDEYVVWRLSFGRRGPVFVEGDYGFIGRDDMAAAVRRMYERSRSS